jgi:hypothetical protein
MEDSSISSSGGEENLDKYTTPEGKVLRWLKELDIVKNSKEQQAYETIGERIIKDYSNSDALTPTSSSSGTPTRLMFNTLWSNVQIQKPLLYCRMPKIVVERRFKDSDPVGRLASQIAERATSFMLSTQQDRFNYSVRAAVEDRLLVGRGQVWLRYDTEYQEAVDETGQPILDENGQPVKIPKPNTEKVVVEHINWKNYYESPARNQFEIRWRAREVYMTRDKLVSRFADKGKKVSLDGDAKKDTAEGKDFLRQARVYEICDEETKTNIWISPGYKAEPLDERPDPLKLKDFWPCPVPLLATTTTNSQWPTPDYVIYESLAKEADYVTKRISSLVECIRLVGATAKQFNQDIKNMRGLEDGNLWPIENWNKFVEKGGFDGVIDWLPFEKAVAAIQPLLAYRDDILNKIDLITGIPDHARGYTNPNETATAQQAKSRWVTVKAQEKQADVQRFCREIVSKMAEIIFEPGLFADETIALMCGAAQMPPDDQQNYYAALQLLRDDRLRTFRVDIETDSTIAIDEDSEKEAALEYMGALNQMIANVQNVQQFRPELMGPMVESAKAAVRNFRAGRNLEGAWDQAWQQIEDADKAARENPPPPPPDYEGQKVQNQAEEIRLKGEMNQFTQWLESQKFGLDQWFKQQEIAIKGGDITNKQMAVQAKSQIEMMEHELKLFNERFAQAMDQKRFQLETVETMLSEKEKLLEEERLRRTEITEEAKVAETKKSKAPSVHVNFGGSGGKTKRAKKQITDIIRDEHGRMARVMTEDVDDEDEEHVDVPMVGV